MEYTRERMPRHASRVVLVVVLSLPNEALAKLGPRLPGRGKRTNCQRSQIENEDEVGITHRSMTAGNRSASASRLLRPDRAIDSTERRPEEVSDG
jgi:hypothetical protein